MTLSQESTLVGFDAEAALDAVRGEVGGDLLVAVEFTTEDHATLYAADEVIDLYGDEERMLEHFEDIHSYLHVDLTERQLFEDVVAAGEVRAMVTFMDYATLVRVLAAYEGLFITVAPDAPVTPVVAAIEDAVEM